MKTSDATEMPLPPSGALHAIPTFRKYIKAQLWRVGQEKSSYQVRDPKGSAAVVPFLKLRGSAWHVAGAQQSDHIVIESH